MKMSFLAIMVGGEKNNDYLCKNENKKQDENCEDNDGARCTIGDKRVRRQGRGAV